MEFGHELTLRGIVRPRDSDGPSTIDLHVNWMHCRRVLHRTNDEVLPPIADEPVGDLSSSHFDFSCQLLSELRQGMWISITSLEFPIDISNSLFDQIMSLVIDLVIESPAFFWPSLVIIADINFVHRVLDDHGPPPLEIVPLRHLSASASVNSTPDIIMTTDWVDYEFDNDSSSEVDEDNNTGTEMLGRIERVKWAMGEGGGEVNCSICLDEFSEGQQVMTVACKHSYHEQCLLPWLNRNQTCPLCRRPI